MTKQALFLLFICCIGQWACSPNPNDNSASTSSANLTEFVNPFIGTGGHGHTYPGASAPFGMMQLSPDTRLRGWDGCSGYHYSDEYIYGFSHTHLNGTGVSDYGDILLMPTVAPILNNGEDGKAGYRTKFSHENESAAPGYYRVLLDSTDIEVELTTNVRSGMHRYRFPSAENQWLVLDLEHRDEAYDFMIDVVSAREINGHRHSKAWAEQQFLYYNLQFSHDIDTESLQYSENKDKLVFKFKNPNNEPVWVKAGISPVDKSGAKQNLEKEIGNKSFDEIKAETTAAWEKNLHKVEIQTDDIDRKTVFYTAMYHAMLAPNIYQDTDGRYRGQDLKIHQTEDFDYYTVFSLWDTYRALHPFFTIVDEKRTNDFVNTFLAKYEEGGIMPIWDLSSNYTDCMIGYHAVPVIADAYLKGIKGYDTEKAMEAMLHSAGQSKLGLKYYKKSGFIPVEEEAESVSKTLEYAYDDWTIAQMAKAMNKQEVYTEFMQRAQSYKNVYDPSTKFMRGRFRNTWFEPFDPYEVNFNYTEANAWQYSFYVPQDISGLMKIMGGKAVLDSQLDSLFTANANTSGFHMKDITGLVGQYAHGNEPSHHMAYLYNFVNKPHKTQQRVREILTQLYTNKPEGIAGNEDCGQMSAWYILSSMGFYPVTPGSNQYIIGAPLFEKAKINLENGKNFSINAENFGESNIYVQSVKLNGKPYPYSYLRHEDISTGGTLTFQMGAKPSDWATTDAHIPVTAIKENLITPAPSIMSGDITFKGKTEVELVCAEPAARIFYRLGAGKEFQPYEKPISISEAGFLTVYTEKDGNKSAEIRTDFYKIDPSVTVKLEAEYAKQYSAGGEDALIDGILGAKDYRTGTWQGYQDQDVVATVNLGSAKNIKEVNINFLIDQRSWIFSPTEVICLGSKDGKSFKEINAVKFDSATPVPEAKIENVTFQNNLNQPLQYIKIIAKKLGDVPDWHVGHEYNGKTWIFVDEVLVNM